MPICAVGTQPHPLFLKEGLACGSWFCGSAKSLADPGLERERENQVLELSSFCLRRYYSQSSLQETSSLANLPLDPSAHIRLLGSSHDASTVPKLPSAHSTACNSHMNSPLILHTPTGTMPTTTCCCVETT